MQQRDTLILSTPTALRRLQLLATTLAVLASPAARGQETPLSTCPLDPGLVQVSERCRWATAPPP